MATLGQTLNRMHSGHAEILAAVRDGRVLIGPSTSNGAIIGYRAALKTLCRWQALTGHGDALTEFGHDLLASWNAKRGTAP